MKQLRQYEIVREIGRGGMASVHEAVHVDLGRRVAIKTMLPQLTVEATSVARFVREAKAACFVRHPHIVEIFDFGYDEGAPFLVMELLEGETLRTRLARGEILHVEGAVAILLPIAAAVAHAHTLGIVHRDLKPVNVFLTRGVGGFVWPKVLDFGISKHTDSAAHASWRDAMTDAESIVGTLAYMAPEQIEDATSASAASDQYALAVILYELLTARLPFYGPSAYQLMHNILHAPLAAPSTFNAAISRELDAVVLRALDRDPSRRFASVHSFASHLLAFASRDTCAMWKTGLDVGTASLERTFDGGGESADAGIAVRADIAKRRRRRLYRLQVAGLSIGAMILLLALLGSGRQSTPSAPRTVPVSPAWSDSSSVAVLDVPVREPESVSPPSAVVVTASPSSLPASSTSSSHQAQREAPARHGAVPPSSASTKAPLPVEPKTKRVVEGTNAAPILD